MASLEECPNEILESIVVLLDLEDICKLRLTSRSLAEKTVQEHFKSYFRSRKVFLAESELRAFVEGKPKWMGSLLQDLELTGVNSLTEDDNVCQELLGQILQGIATDKKDDGLRCLTLSADSTPVREVERGWKPVWRTAARAFRLAMLALADSGLVVQQLKVFDDGQLQCLAFSQLDAMDFTRGLPVSTLATLKSLSISLSDNSPTRPQPKPSLPSISELEAILERNYNGFASFIQCCTSLEDLEIHYFHLHAVGVRPERILQKITSLEHLPRLKKCKLRGLFVNGEDLLTFLNRTTPPTLHLEYLHLYDGTYRPIFDYCTRVYSGLINLRLEELFEGHRGVYFDGFGKVDKAKTRMPLFSSTGRGDSTSTLVRKGADVKWPITYHYHEGMCADTSRIRKHREQRKREFGPPY